MTDAAAAAAGPAAAAPEPPEKPLLPSGKKVGSKAPKPLRPGHDDWRAVVDHLPVLFAASASGQLPPSLRKCGELSGVAAALGALSSACSRPAPRSPMAAEARPRRRLSPVPPTLDGRRERNASARLPLLRCTERPSQRPHFLAPRSPRPARPLAAFLGVLLERKPAVADAKRALQASVPPAYAAAAPECLNRHTRLPPLPPEAVASYPGGCGSLRASAASARRRHRCRSPRSDRRRRGPASVPRRPARGGRRALPGRARAVRGARGRVL